MDKIQYEKLGEGTYCKVVLKDNYVYKFYPEESYSAMEKECLFAQKAKQFDKFNMLCQSLEIGQIKFQEKNGQYVKTEYRGIPIDKYINKNDLTLSQFMDAYATFCHEFFQVFTQNNITHFDIKTSNVLFLDGKINLIDYNLSFFNEKFIRENFSTYDEPYFCWTPEVNLFTCIELQESKRLKKINYFEKTYVKYLHTFLKNIMCPFYKLLYYHLKDQSNVNFSYTEEYNLENMFAIDQYGFVNQDIRIVDWWGIGLMGCECLYKIYNKLSEPERTEQLPLFLNACKNICQKLILNGYNGKLSLVIEYIKSLGKIPESTMVVCNQLEKTRIDLEIKSSLQMIKIYAKKKRKDKNVILSYEKEMLINYLNSYCPAIEKTFFLNLIFDTKFHFLYEYTEYRQTIFQLLEENVEKIGNLIPYFVILFE